MLQNPVDPVHPVKTILDMVLELTNPGDSKRIVEWKGDAVLRLIPK